MESGITGEVGGNQPRLDGKVGRAEGGAASGDGAGAERDITQRLVVRGKRQRAGLDGEVSCGSKGIRKTEGQRATANRCRAGIGVIAGNRERAVAKFYETNVTATLAIGSYLLHLHFSRDIEAEAAPCKDAAWSRVRAEGVEDFRDLVAGERTIRSHGQGDGTAAIDCDF